MDEEPEQRGNRRVHRHYARSESPVDGLFRRRCDEIPGAFERGHVEVRRLIEEWLHGTNGKTSKRGRLIRTYGWGGRGGW